MKRQSLLTLIFAVLFTMFFLLLIVFRIPFPPYPLMSYQDVFDLLTPVVLIPVYWLLYKEATNGESQLTEEIVLMIFVSVWVLGHGMHLAANSVNNLAEEFAKEQVIDITRTDIYTLTYFIDEHLSHYLWHIGVLGLAVLLMYAEWRRPAVVLTTWWHTALAGLIYGFASFCIFLEGQTVPLGLPFMIIVILLVLKWGREKLAQKPISAFFFVSCLVAVLLFAGWGLYWGGFPQFSDVGLI